MFREVSVKMRKQIWENGRFSTFFMNIRFTHI